jgi:hypothetical protein
MDRGNDIDRDLHTGGEVLTTDRRISGNSSATMAMSAQQANGDGCHSSAAPGRGLPVTLLSPGLSMLLVLQLHTQSPGMASLNSSGFCCKTAEHCCKLGNRCCSSCSFSWFQDPCNQPLRGSAVL